LSRDEIYYPHQENSYGHDVLIRISDFMQSPLSTYAGEASTEQVSNSLKKQRTYVINISLKCYHESSCVISREMIKEEVAKVLYSVSSQLDLEETLSWLFS